MATQDLIVDCCCRILVGNPGADGGIIVAGSPMATQDLIDYYCRILVGNPGSDGGTIVAGTLMADSGSDR
jgi:hypothetical protein